ncbi:hypothetical protein DY000_02052189 [Brassica cretica]|uniref:Uncharacterized protein n=1 Tax=Brassica cretica TaxID=69181 RepID=A0ABQ7AHR0_BRACR|nr:hypothetical protein DY000_02052189 [Brassica cretica]
MYIRRYVKTYGRTSSGEVAYKEIVQVPLESDVDLVWWRWSWRFVGGVSHRVCGDQAVRWCDVLVGICGMRLVLTYLVKHSMTYLVKYMVMYFRELCEDTKLWCGRMGSMPVCLIPNLHRYLSRKERVRRPRCFKLLREKHQMKQTYGMRFHNPVCYCEAEGHVQRGGLNSGHRANHGGIRLMDTWFGRFGHYEMVEWVSILILDDVLGEVHGDVPSERWKVEALTQGEFSKDAFIEEIWKDCSCVKPVSSGAAGWDLCMRA